MKRSALERVQHNLSGFSSRSTRDLPRLARYTSVRHALIGAWMFVVLWSSATLLADDIAEKSLANWPQWRGPTFNGVAPLGDPPVRWSATENLRWKTPIEGRGHSTPVVWGERIFLVTAIPIDKRTGEEIWRENREEGRTAVLKRGPQLEVLAVNSLDETFYASPAIVGNEIYLRGDKHLFCFSKSSGK